jgi:hypothetical protein
MNRRNFFATLLAPFLARFRTPKVCILKARALGPTTAAISSLPRFQFGFTGFKSAQASLAPAGQFIVGSNLIQPPRLQQAYFEALLGALKAHDPVALECAGEIVRGIH